MKYWIINHRYSSYEEHKDLIGLPAKFNNNGELVPKYRVINEIEQGDKFVYYCPSPKSAVIGVFEIIEGPDNYASDWKKSIQFKIRPIYPIKEENQISYYDLIELLKFFKDDQGNQLSKHSAALKLKGTIKPLEKSDFEKVVEILLAIEDESGTISSLTLSEISLHINMIKKSHISAFQFNCESYIAPAERNRLEESINQEDEDTIPNLMDKLPNWLFDIGTQLGTVRRIMYIDNIWFLDESKGFLIPFALFEHEKDGNLRTVMDHFFALNYTLSDNKRFKSIKPLYFLIGKDEMQIENYKRQIESHGEWKNFMIEHNIFLFTYEKINSPEFNRILNSHIREIFQ